MRLLITTDKETKQEGFNLILIEKEGDQEQIDKVIDSCCTMLVVEGAADVLPYEQSVELITKSIRKIRLNGEIVIRGLSFEHLSSMYKANEINIEDVNKQILNISSFQDYKNIIYNFDRSNFTVESLTFAEATYEIRATRND